MSPPSSVMQPPHQSPLFRYSNIIIPKHLRRPCHHHLRRHRHHHFAQTDAHLHQTQSDITDTIGLWHQWNHLIMLKKLNACMLSESLNILEHQAFICMFIASLELLGHLFIRINCSLRKLIYIHVIAHDVSTVLRCWQNPIIFLINNGGYTIEIKIYDGPYDKKNLKYTGSVDAIHNGQGKCYEKGEQIQFNRHESGNKIIDYKNKLAQLRAGKSSNPISIRLNSPASTSVFSGFTITDVIQLLNSQGFEVVMVSSGVVGAGRQRLPHRKLVHISFGYQVTKGLASVRKRCKGSLSIPIGLRTGIVVSSLVFKEGGFFIYQPTFCQEVTILVLAVRVTGHIIGFS
ncbi:pyruvate decarboxylase [Artemisia annua]|uniref:Pyruvate decarboxylase n=1 Tax=Artemisia annua TaxID=35608 RepID=A0A2U1M2W8_ARTAN|nr:pyruvate decarboxylase [Artemisia annua]